MPDSLQTQLAEGLQQLSLEMSQRQRQQLLEYLALVEKWNRTYNLTAVTDPQEMLGRHLLDSLALVPNIHGTRILDIGTGAGLPGIPLAIARPEHSFTLLDSSGKKIRFLNHVIRSLGMQNTKTEQNRIEEYQPEELPDTITARAVASLAQICSWCDGLTASGTRILAMKGRYPGQELLALPARFCTERVLELEVPGEPAQRHLVIMRRKD